MLTRFAIPGFLTVGGVILAVKQVKMFPVLYTDVRRYALPDTVLRVRAEAPASALSAHVHPRLFHDVILMEYIALK